MLSTEDALPSNREFARYVMDRIERFRAEVRKCSDLEIETSSGLGRGTISNIRAIADGRRDGSFRYASIETIDVWLAKQRKIAADTSKETTSEVADA